MAIAPLSHPTKTAIVHSIAAQPAAALPARDASTAPQTRGRSRRDLPFVSLENANSAKQLVENSDSEMAIHYAFALAEGEASPRSAETDNWNPPRMSTIAPYSTFGMAWSNFARVLKAEPFATFATTHNIDTSTLRWNPNYGGTLECRVNGKITTFADHVPGWTQASADLKAAASLLRDRFTYSDEHSAPTSLVASFYGSPPNPKDRLCEIGTLLNTGSFPGLSGSTQPHPRVILDDQRQTILGVASLRASGQIPAVAPAASVATQVKEADKAAARLSAAALLTTRNEIRPHNASPMSGHVITPPVRSTLGQTIKAFNRAFQAEAVMDFVRTKNLDPSNLYIRLPAGDLVVLDSVNRVFRTVATVHDQSGWAQVSGRIRALASELGEGTNELVQHAADGSISLTMALNFYGVPFTPRPLAETLAHGAMLYHQGFPALNPDTALTDERSRKVQQRQRAAIQRLDTPGTPQPHPLAAIAQRQFAAEPTLYSVITRLLNDKISATQQALDIDVNQLAIAAPDPDNPGQLKYTQLLTLALDYLAGGDAPNFTSADQAFDTRADVLARTGTPAKVPLALDLPALSAAIRDLPAQLSDAFEADSREYWNKPAFNTSGNTAAVFPGNHRAVVSSILRSNLQLAALKKPGLDEEQRKTLGMVLTHPDGSTRPAPLDSMSSGATVYSFPGASPNLLIHRALSPSNREILLLVEPNGKITPYTRWDDLKALGTPREVTGNMFDAQADILIQQHQGNSLSDLPTTMPLDTAKPIKTPLPDWLATAGEAERFVLQALSLELAGFIQRNKGRAYSDGIPDIRTFAQQQFDQLPASKKLTQYAAEDLEVVFKVAQGAPGTSGYVERKTMSLTDMLLNNLSGLPNGQVEVFFKTGLKENGVEIKTRVPALEQELYLKTLVDELDIGTTYPALLKKDLLGAPEKTAERRALFTQQVPIELQMKALELSIKGESGFNATGFRYVQEILKPQPGPKSVDGKDIVIRPLAFDNKPQGTIDVVEGAYLIEPKDSSTGPHILYRPLIAEAPLLQFASRQALLDAIQNKGKLQNDTLAWLPENVQKEYSGNGFKHPNLVIFGVNLGSVPLNQTIPLAVDNRLQQTLQDGKLMEHLYEANAQSLITLAEHQSTASAQSRWASLKEGGFLLLNALLPALRGPAATLGLLLQAEGIVKDLQTLTDADSKNKEAALADLLTNLATLLLHFKTRPSLKSPTTPSTRATTGGSRLVDGVIAPAPPSHTQVRVAAPVEINPRGASAKVPRLMVMKGTMKETKLVKDDLFTFVDEYKGKPRLNINAHGRDLGLREKLSGSPSTIIYEGAEHSAAQLHADLLAKGIEPATFANTRLLVCYSANGSENSFAADFQRLINKPVKAFMGTVTVTPSPELVTAEFDRSTEQYGKVQGPLLLSETYAVHDNVDILKNRSDISMLNNPIEYFLFTYFPVYHPPRTNAMAG